MNMPEHPWHSDPERHIDDAALSLSCHVYGQAPVQADGRIEGKPFYFRSRWAAWTFTLCVSHDIDASTIHPLVERPGFFQVEDYRGYFLAGDYGTEPEASFIRYDEVERIIRECARWYLRDAAEVG